MNSQHDTWKVTVDDPAPHQERVIESLFTVADGTIGTRGSVEEPSAGADPLVMASGCFDERGGESRPLAGPRWTAVPAVGSGPAERDHRDLDLCDGVLHRVAMIGAISLQSSRFASMTRPGVAALRVATTPGSGSDCPLELVEAGEISGPEPDGTWTALSRGGEHNSITATAVEEVTGSDDTTSTTIERIVAYSSLPDPAAGALEARSRLAKARSVGFAGLLAEQRTAWSNLWNDAAVSIQGDAEAERAIRLALFHVLSSVGTGAEAALGARGMSGPNYSGHVFWDADVFVLPVLAACRPRAARAMVSYRYNRLGAAMEAARRAGHRGARFPWESARSGEDVTPRWTTDAATGEPVAVLSGAQEEHIAADVAWSAFHYCSWSGDLAFAEGPARRLLGETARYWASRIEWDDRDRAHILGVMGPDEYHESVDDNAYTNIMARWNLRAAAGETAPPAGAAAGSPVEVSRWKHMADSLVDGLDPGTGVYEQFVGFHALGDQRITEFAEPPVAADLLLGRDRVSETQIVKQPDVLMAHHIVPDQVAAGSLRANLDHYLPRTAYGSSLAPAICASLLARAGRAEEALELFRMAARMDLDDLTGTTAGGLHLATMGGLWQALAFGFAGLAETGGRLTIDPILPSTWEEIDMHFCFRGRRVRLRLRPDLVEIRTDGSLQVVLGSNVHVIEAPRARFTRRSGEWEATS